ncbi:ABC transporter permease [Nocardioides sp. BP30]|uniref:ABC transporter permease n=1 Tax=Nocardioides sp. BP30 TaxID=3036374 RepID=UPI002468A409|nr:ABC transporter permease [Nocardioides sp. BP30]WGL52458.1 ABC transporter permease [Nocardioides sp. BP30]
MRAVIINGLRERWHLYLGSFLTVALGVGLAQSSLVLLLGAVREPVPAEASPVDQMRFQETNLTAVTVLAVMLAFAAFLAVAIIGSTFAFTIAQRRRELALLRLVGAGVADLRRVLLGEAALLGGAGAAVGVVAGAGLQRLETALVSHYGFVPPHFAPAWPVWIIPASLAIGPCLSIAGVLVAARRIQRVRPLDALRETGEQARRLTVLRLVSGSVLGLGALALFAAAPYGGRAGGQAMAMCVAIAASLCFAALAPVIVPALAVAVPRAGVGGRLSAANLRDAAQRSASIAAPVIVLCGLLLSQPIAMLSFASSRVDELHATTSADLVVTGTGPVGAGIHDATGVIGASTQYELPVALDSTRDEAGAGTTADALVVDPADYTSVHPSADVDALAAGAVTTGVDTVGSGLGGQAELRVGPVDLGVVRLSGSVAGSAGSVLIPRRRVPTDLLADAPATTFVTTGGNVTAATLRDLARFGHVQTFTAWLDAQRHAGHDASSDTLVVVLALGVLYAVIGVVNSIAIAASDRRREYAAMRAAGLTRGQTLRTAVLETWMVVIAGLVLGIAAAAATAAAAGVTTRHLTGTVALVVPWPLLGATAATVLGVTGAAGLWTAWSATRDRPVVVLQART